MVKVLLKELTILMKGVLEVAASLLVGLVAFGIGAGLFWGVVMLMATHPFIGFPLICSPLIYAVGRSILDDFLV